jgi:hypothetical protein
MEAVGGNDVDAGEDMEGEVEAEVGTVFAEADPTGATAVLLPVSPPPHAARVPTITRLAIKYFTDTSPSSKHQQTNCIYCNYNGLVVFLT